MPSTKRSPKELKAASNSYIPKEELEEIIDENFNAIEVPDIETLKEPEEQLEPEEKFSMKPKEIKSHLDKYVISQEQAKRVLSVAIFEHHKRLTSEEPIEKNNIILLGPTGVGKTLTVKIAAKLLSVPFAEVDMTEYTETGFVGKDSNDMLKIIYAAAEGDEKLAGKAVVYLDEIDKIADKQKNYTGTDIGGYQVQRNILKLIEGTIAQLSNRHSEEMIPIDTKNMLFVCSGAFQGLEEIIAKRLAGGTTIGFGAKITKKEEKYNFDKIEAEDLEKYGFLPEFIGRAPVITPFMPLSKEDLRKILTEPKDSLVSQYKKLFNPIKLQFTDEALDLIAEEAHKRKLKGARALREICENFMLDLKYELYGTETKELTITKETILNSKKDYKG